MSIKPVVRNPYSAGSAPVISEILPIHALSMKLVL